MSEFAKVEEVILLAEKMADKTHEIMVGDLPVTVKEIPNMDGENIMDPIALAIELKLHKRGDALPEESSKEAKATLEERLDKTRAVMGSCNRNLNTKEVYTRYMEVETSYGKVPVWIYYPRWMKDNRPGLLFIHGGAFYGGSPYVMENQCKYIAEKADCVVFNIDYTLAPEGAYPRAGSEVYEVLKYIHEDFMKQEKAEINHRKGISLDVNKLAVTGDSAGGNLAAVCALMDKDYGTNYLAAQILLYPKMVFDNYEISGYVRDVSAIHLEEEYAYLLPFLLVLGTDDSNAGDMEAYITKEEDKYAPYVNPMYGKLEGLPQTTIMLAEYDGLRLEGEHYAKLLKKAGVPTKVFRYQGVGHAFLDRFGIQPQAQDLANEIAKVLLSL